MINAKQLAQTIEVEQKVLYSKIQTEFWQVLFRDILQEHTFTTETHIRCRGLRARAPVPVLRVA